MRVLCTCALCVCECECVCVCATKPQTTVMKFQLSSLSCAAWVRVCVSVFVPHCVCVCTSVCVWHTCCCRISSKQKLVSASPLLASPRLALARLGASTTFVAHTRTWLVAATDAHRHMHSYTSESACLNFAFVCSSCCCRCFHCCCCALFCFNPSTPDWT